MATTIGTVKTLVGTATATAMDGTVRNLQSGSSVYPEELIVTGMAGAVVIGFLDGSMMDLGRNSQLVLDNSIFDPNTVVESASIATVDDALQQAILEGADPTQVAEATAAGAGTQAEGNEGHSPVIVDYLAPEVIPESGFETTGVSVAFPEIEEELQAAVVDEPVEVEDVVIVSISTGIEGGSAIEGDDVTFTVSQDSLSSADTTVVIEVLSLPGDSAVEGGDYQVIDTVTVVIPAGSDVNTFNVGTHLDTLEEGNETFSARIVSVSNPDGSVGIGTAIAVGTIIDDYTPPEVSISTGIEGGSAVEGDDVTFTVSQDSLSSADTTVVIEVLSLPGDSAVEGGDYQVIDTVTVVIPAGSDVNTFNVGTHLDTLEEGNETFSARIVSATNPGGSVAIGTAIAVGTIIDDYTPPEVSISTGIEGGSAIEGDDVTFTVSQDSLSSADTTVVIEVLSLPGDSAVEGGDYQVIDTVTVVIPAGSDVNTFNVGTHLDTLEEGNETFSARIVSVSNPDGSVAIGTAIAVGTIIDDYTPPEVSISTGIEGGSAIEGDDVTFTVSQDSISSGDTTVVIEVLSLPGDSAVEGGDYQVIDTVTVVIPAGSDVNTFNVATHLDTLEEGDETFSARIVSATNPNGTVDIGVAVAAGTILDQYDSPLGGDTVSLSADEALIVDTVVDNSLTFTAGTADLTSFQFDTDLSSLKLDTNEDGLDDVSWNRVNDTQVEGLIGTSVAVTLNLTASTITAGATADVTVQAVLDDAFQHLGIPGRNPLDLGSINVIASTTAGDDAVGTAFVAVIDDIIEITSISNTNLANVAGADAAGDLVIDTGADGLASLIFTGTVPLGLTTSNGHEISYQSQTDGGLIAIDENNDSVFTLTQNDTGDGYTISLDQLLQGPIVETTVSLTGSVVDAGAPVGGITQVSQNGIIVNLSATDDSGSDLINASSDGFGVDNGLIDEGDSEIAIIALEDPNGSFSDMSVTVGNFSTAGNSVDIYSYQLYLDGAPVGSVQNVAATATNESADTTISINGSGFDEIQMWASHSGGNARSEGSYKVISVDSDVTATSSEDVVLNFGVDVIDTDGDFHGGDFQVAVDINGDSTYLSLDDPSLDTLLNDTVDELV